MAIYLITYAFIIIFFVIEKLLRKGSTAKSYKRGSYDKGSTLTVAFTFIVSLIIVTATFVLNPSVGSIEWNSFEWIGITCMFVGLVIRIYSTLTLGKYYTRTLVITNEQKIIKHGLYKFIRHPGYFGVFLLWIGAALTTSNILTILLVTVIEFIGYSYRIRIEEKMLQDVFGEEYLRYKKRTYTFIPFLY